MLGSGLWEASTAEFVENFGLLSSRRWWIWLLDASATPCSTCICRALVQASGLRSAGRHSRGTVRTARMVLTGGLAQQATAAFLPMVSTGYDMTIIFISLKLRLPPVHTSAAAYCHYDVPKIDSRLVASLAGSSAVFDKHVSCQRVSIHGSFQGHAS